MNVSTIHKIFPQNRAQNRIQCEIAYNSDVRRRIHFRRNKKTLLPEGEKDCALTHHSKKVPIGDIVNAVEKE